jgi:hypothetical protein
MELSGLSEFCISTFQVKSYVQENVKKAYKPVFWKYIGGMSSEVEWEMFASVILTLTHQVVVMKWTGATTCCDGSWLVLK